MLLPKLAGYVFNFEKQQHQENISIDPKDIDDSLSEDVDSISDSDDKEEEEK